MAIVRQLRDAFKDGAVKVYRVFDNVSGLLIRMDTEGSVPDRRITVEIVNLNDTNERASVTYEPDQNGSLNLAALNLRLVFGPTLPNLPDSWHLPPGWVIRTGMSATLDKLQQREDERTRRGR